MVQIPSHWQWNNSPLEPSNAVIFDIDGVLADASGRHHFIKSEKPDWHGFFDAAGDDTPIESSVALIADHSESQIILLTARPIRIRELTLEWLTRHKVSWDLLVMRSKGSYVKAPEFKRTAVVELKSAGFDIVMAYEDDEHICAMYESEGVPVTYIHSGYYENRVNASSTEADS